MLLECDLNMIDLAAALEVKDDTLEFLSARFSNVNLNVGHQDNSEEEKKEEEEESQWEYV